MACFVVGCNALVRFRHRARLFGGAHYHFVDTLVDVRHGNDFSAVADSQYCRFVEQVFKVCARKACRDTRHLTEVYVRSDGLFACVNFKNSFAPSYVGAVDEDLSVETSRTNQCRVKNVRAVGCRHYDNVGVGLETVHFNQQLVKRLFLFVVTATETCAALTTYRVDFIDKDDARHVFLCLIEQISYAACAHADKHFDKVTTADREERHACLACNGFGKQRFTCSRRTYKQHAVRDTRSDVVVLLRIFKEVDDFL